MKQFIYLASTLLLVQAHPQGWNSPPSGWSSAPPEGWSSNPPPGWSPSPGGWSGGGGSGWSGAPANEGTVAAAGSTLVMTGVSGSNVAENPLYINGTSDSFSPMTFNVSNYQESEMIGDFYDDYVNATQPDVGSAESDGTYLYNDLETYHSSGMNVSGVTVLSYSQDLVDYSEESIGSLASSGFAYVTNGTNVSNNGNSSGWGSGSGWKKED